MERHLIPEDARGAWSGRSESTATLSRDFAQALSVPDVRLARRIVNDALDLGVAPGRLYVEVVRPALSVRPLDAATIEAQLLASLGRAIVADFVGALPSTIGGGDGRAALLSCGESTIEQLDGLVVCDFLEADGWAVQRLHGPQSALELGPASRADGVELAVAVIGGPEEALRLAPACTEMHRLPDPPVCLLCDFTGRSDRPAASTALGADAFVSDPQELLTQAAGRLPAGVTRRWGVSISRRSDALVLSPTGRLDATSAGRLAEVVESRLGSFARLVIDLRDLAEISMGGVEDICAWQGNAPLEDIELLLVGDAGVRSRIDALGMQVPMLLADAATI